MVKPDIIFHRNFIAAHIKAIDRNPFGNLKLKTVGTKIQIFDISPTRNQRIIPELRPDFFGKKSGGKGLRSEAGDEAE